MAKITCYIIMLSYGIFLNQLNYQTGQVCNKISYPPNYNDARCIEMWTRAKQAVPRSQRADFKRAGKIRIATSTGTVDCYKDKLFRKKGWCSTMQSVSGDGWGFCSSSCDMVGHTPYPPEKFVVIFNLYYAIGPFTSCKYYL